MNESLNTPSPEMAKDKNHRPIGLTEEEVAQRRQQHESNTLEKKHPHPIRKFRVYFWGPIPWMIEVTALLSLITRDGPDLAIILALLFIQAINGFVQEHKADRAIAVLKDPLALHARVKRVGQWNTITDQRDAPPIALEAK